MKNGKSHPPTLDALISALTAPRPTGHEGVTLGELGAQLGWSATRLRKLMLGIQASGRLVVGRALRPALDGSMRPVPVYSLRNGKP